MQSCVARAWGGCWWPPVRRLRAKWGHDRLELQVRIELVENQQAFAKMGFVKVSENCHPGYGCVTEITMQKILSAVKPSKL